jgi:hypothetical protein
MKIELTDREHWLDEIDKRLSYIEYVRDKENKQMEALPWYKQAFLGTFDYPSMFAWGYKHDLGRVRDALLADHTGIIYVDSKELQALTWEVIDDE